MWNECVRIFPYRAQVADFNRKKLRENYTEKEIITVRNESQTLEIAVGVEVILLKNIASAAGLCNGSLGIVKFLQKRADGEILYIAVDFYSYIGSFFLSSSHGKGFPVYRTDVLKWDKITSSYKKYKIFPLSLSYAYTGHKSQGANIKKVAARLGESEFCAGPNYVMLSRCRRLEDPLILDTCIAHDRFSENTNATKLRIVEDKRLKRLSENHFTIIRNQDFKSKCHQIKL
ncbi:unnamed protein product [Allacma fusca]|uniref:DNA helicase Pif1-like 2B domain-containing protein n=1 Tax=Allacma fusca TaxID=39272 RepID=A0A8J2KI14_9HEXA|nr:unnamed protein product [Allacma fusca]